MATTSKNRELFRTARRSSRPRRSASARAKGCTPALYGNSFLKAKFAPLICTAHRELSSQHKIEKGFYKSLSNLCDYYGLVNGFRSQSVYPVNLFESFQHVKAQFEVLHRDLSLSVIQDDLRPCTFITTKTCCTGHTLYYIPVEPLFNLMEDKNQRKTANLLLSVLAYLYQTVKISHFREPSSYLYYIYHMIEDWIGEDDDNEIHDEKLSAEFSHLKFAGDLMLKAMKNKRNLIYFGSRIKGFKPQNDAEQEILNIARLAFTLMCDYQERSIFDNINESMYLVDDNEDDGKMCVQNYLCFFWGTNGTVYESLWNSVECELSEYNIIDEPMTVQYFDKPQISDVHDLSFENRLFAFLSMLCDTLYAL